MRRTEGHANEIHEMAPLSEYREIFVEDLCKLLKAGKWLFILSIPALLMSYFFEEQQGVIKIDDCRATVQVKPDTWDTWFHKFTCESYNNDAGKKVAEFCARAVVDNGTCSVAYTYTRTYK